VRIPKLKKTATEYLRLKTELNRTNILKSKPTQPLKMKNDSKAKECGQD